VLALNGLKLHCDDTAVEFYKKHKNPEAVKKENKRRADAHRASGKTYPSEFIYPLTPDWLGDTSEWDIVSLFKLVTLQKETFKQITISPEGSNKCKDKAYVYVAEPFKLDGKAKYTLSSDSHLFTTGDFKDVVIEQKSKATTKLILNYRNSTFVFTGTVVPTFSAPNGGVVKTINTKELFKNLSSYIEPLYKAEKLAKKPTGFKKYIPKYSATAGKTSFKLEAKELCFKENPNDYSVDMVGKLVFGIGLFEGASGNIDLIPAVTASMDALKDVVDIANVGGDVVLNVSISGGVRGDISIQREAGSKEAKTAGKIVANAGVTLLAKIEADAKVFGVGVKVGAKVVLASEKSVSRNVGIEGTLQFAKHQKEGEIAFDGDVVCTGMTVYYAFYAEIEGRTKDKTKGEDKGGRNDKNPTHPENTPKKTLTKNAATQIDRMAQFPIIHQFSLKEILLGHAKAPQGASMAEYHDMDVALEALNRGIT